MNQEENRIALLKMIKANGGFWSYEGIPEKISDDDIIEEGLQRLEFEDMHLLFEMWPEEHIKRIWKERLLSQGKRMNILNTLLQAVIFSNETKLEMPRDGSSINPDKQDLLGQKLYSICVRPKFKDYYDIYCFLQEGCKLKDAISYASCLSKSKFRAKAILSRLISPMLFPKDAEFMRMNPRIDVTPEQIAGRALQAIKEELW